MSKSMSGNQPTSRLPCGRSIHSSPRSARSQTHAGPKVETFIRVHRHRLNTAFGLHWRRAAAHTAIRYILQGLNPQDVEQAFRRHAAGLKDDATDPLRRTISLDGKTLRL